MAAVKAAVLGLVQGLTEFLPVSSSGHLVLGQHLFGLKEPELLFDVVLHLGTLVAVFIVFRKELVDLVLEFLRLPGLIRDRRLGRAWRERAQFRMMVLIVIGSVPTAILGFAFKDWFESLFSSTLAVGLALVFTGAILYLTKSLKGVGRGVHGFGPADSLLVGLAQGLAITPGLSRSGLTICTGLFLGLERELAARYSFLLSIPAISGALVLQLRDFKPGVFGPVDLGIGFVSAFLSGLFALVILLRLVKRGRLHYFSYYCWLIGLTTIAFSLGIFD